MSRVGVEAVVTRELRWCVPEGFGVKPVAEFKCCLNNSWRYWD